MVTDFYHLFKPSRSMGEKNAMVIEKLEDGKIEIETSAATSTIGQRVLTESIWALHFALNIRNKNSCKSVRWSAVPVPC